MAKTKGKSPKGKAAPKVAAKAAKPVKPTAKSVAAKSAVAKPAAGTNPAPGAATKPAVATKPGTKPTAGAKLAAKPAPAAPPPPAYTPVYAKVAKSDPTRALKPARPSKPSMPLPPPTPAAAPPPAQRDELPAPRDIARLTRYGERFGANKIDVRWLQQQLPVASGELAICDPGVPKSWRVLDRPSGNGQFRAMLSVARTDDGKEKVAAITVHTGRPPITRWTVAHFKGQKKPKSADQLPRGVVTTGWIAIIDAGSGSPGVIAVPPASGVQPIEIPLTDGRRALALPCGNGEFVSYWAVDANDKPICLVIDFDVFTQKDWKARPPA